MRFVRAVVLAVCAVNAYISLLPWIWVLQVDTRCGVCGVIDSDWSIGSAHWFYELVAMCLGTRLNGALPPLAEVTAWGEMWQIWRFDYFVRYVQCLRGVCTCDATGDAVVVAAKIKRQQQIARTWSETATRQPNWYDKIGYTNRTTCGGWLDRIICSVPN